MCREPLVSGEFYYEFKGEFISSSDGYFLEPDEDMDHFVKEAIENLANQSETEMLADIYEYMELILCLECCQKLKRTIRKMIARSVPKKKGKILPFPTPPGKS